MIDQILFFIISLLSSLRAIRLLALAPIPRGLALILRAAFAPILLVGVRITTPRLKLETLPRLGWLAGFGMPLFAVIAYVCVWLML